MLNIHLNNIILITIINLYIYICLKLLRRKMVTKKLNQSFWFSVWLNFIINIINYNLMIFFHPSYVFCFLFLHLISSIVLRNLLIIVFYKFYDKINYFNQREYLRYKFIDFDTKSVAIMFFILIMFFPKLYIVYLTLISMFNFNSTEKQYDEAILNRYDDCKIRLFFRGRKKIARYKKHLLDPKINNKYKFYNGYLLNDEKNHLILIWGIDFKFCKSFHNRMFKNHNL